ncbi:hypothetical protein [Streptomyces sp. NPDC007905]
MYDFAVPHLRSRAPAPDETVADGFERVVEASLPVLRDGSTGKILVHAA